MSHTDQRPSERARASLVEHETKRTMAETLCALCGEAMPRKGVVGLPVCMNCVPPVSS